MKENLHQNKLPIGWKWAKLQDFCEKISLNNIKIKQKVYLKSGKYPVVDQGQELVGGYYNDEKLLVPGEPPYIIFGDHTKVKKYVNFKFIAGADGVKVLKPKDSIDPKFLYYCLFTIHIEDKGYARHFQLIEKELLPLPPKSTQEAIVSKIEELFSELDKGIENLLTVKQKLLTYRQSVLKWAFEGRLTNDNCLSSHEPHNRVFWVKSGELFDFVTSGSRGWAKYYSNKGSIFIRVTNLDFDSLELDLQEKKIQYVNPPADSEGIRTKVKEGDFLFSITGYLGMFAIAHKIENAYVNQHISLCRPKSSFNKKYVGYWIISKTGGHLYLNKMTKGATKAGLGLSDIKNFPVPITSIAEQQKVVEAIESRLSIADKMKESITQSLQQAAALRQSILKKAFEGKLIIE